MKGLFLNRWYEARIQFLVMCGVSILIFVVNLLFINFIFDAESLDLQSISIALFALPMISMILFTEIGVGGVINDIKTHFLRYAISAPVSRIKYIVFYYISALAVMFFGTILGIVSSVGIASIYGAEASQEDLSVIFTFILVILIFELVQIPVTLKIKKYDLAGMITFGITFVIVYVINLFVDNDIMGLAQSLIGTFTDSVAVKITVILGVAAMCVASGAVSYLILKKEEI